MGYIIAILSVAIPTAIAVVLGLLAMTPPEYQIAEYFIIGIAAAIGSLSLIWGITSTEGINLRLSIGIVGILFSTLGINPALWWLEAKANSVSAASENISNLSDDQLRARASVLSTKMRDFETRFKEELIDAVPMIDRPTLTQEQIDELWIERSNTLVRVSSKANIEFKRLFLPELVALIKVMRERIPGEIPPIPPEALATLNGEPASSSSASSSAADYLEVLASKLP
jgi:hypothetical protein